jgi:hypothetical protein
MTPKKPTITIPRELAERLMFVVDVAANIAAEQAAEISTPVVRKVHENRAAAKLALANELAMYLLGELQT